MKVKPIQSDFSAGELSPAMMGRSDIEAYFKGAQELTNAIVHPQGGCSKRQGTFRKFPREEIGDPAYAFPPPVTKIRTLRFQITNTVVFTIDMFNGGFRISKPGIATEAPLFVTNIFNTTTPIPYQPNEIDDVAVNQSNDQLFMVHPNHPPAILSHYGDNDWRFEQFLPKFGPYLDNRPQDSFTQLYVSDVVDRTVVNSSANTFLPGDVGQYIEIPNGQYRVLAIVREYISAKRVIAETLEDECLVLSKEVYSPGAYTGWDSTNSVPIYGAIPAPPNGDVTIAFSATGVVTQENVGTKLRFCDKYGNYYWLSVVEIVDVLKMGAYGICARGSLLDVKIPVGIITTESRTIFAKLTSTAPDFFNTYRDMGRWFRLDFGGNIVHAQAVNSNQKTFTRQFNITSGTNFVATDDLKDLTEGLSITGLGIPTGTVIHRVQQERQAAVVNGVIGWAPGPGGIGGNPIYGVVANIPYLPSGFYMTKAATQTNANVLCSLGDSFGETSFIRVTLDRTIPRVVEGLRTWQNGVASSWRRGSFYQGNFPSAISIFEERLVLACTYNEPQTFWLSRTGDYYNFAGTNEKGEVLDSSAITSTVAGDQTNEIMWLVSRARLIVGTRSAEWVISSGQSQQPITPRNISARAQSSYGSATRQALIIGPTVIYVQDGGTKLRMMKYDYTSDSFESADLSIRSEHLPRKNGGITHIDAVMLPDPFIVARTANGNVLAMTYETDQQVFAWSRLMATNDVQDFCATTQGLSSQLHLVIRRNNYYVTEVLPFASGGDSVGPHIDSKVLFTAAGDHVDLASLADKYVTLVATDDSGQLGYKAGHDGKILIPKHLQGKDVWVGLPFASRLHSFPLDPQGVRGTSQGSLKRIDHIGVRVLNSGGMYVSAAGGPVTEVTHRQGNEATGKFPKLFTGVVKVNTPSSSGMDVSVVIDSDTVQPLTVLAIYPEVDSR